ncbi:putative uncharacterized protein [Clostridium sp. CAG:678]|nr:putative uncharacterized protein [Clostridium sp. CAG:678]
MNGKKVLFQIASGDTFKVGNFEFIVLAQNHVLGTTEVLLIDFWKTTKFDDSTNNYKNSSIRKKLNSDFYDELVNEVGTINIIPHTVNLTADDGRKDYGICDDCVSLLTCEQYRKYVDIVDKYRITSNWWWLATPYSTGSNGYDYTVRCADLDGTLNDNDCNYDNGVRPFCIFKSGIFVS